MCAYQLAVHRYCRSLYSGKLLRDRLGILAFAKLAIAAILDTFIYYNFWLLDDQSNFTFGCLFSYYPSIAASMLRPDTLALR